MKRSLAQHCVQSPPPQAAKNEPAATPSALPAIVVLPQGAGPSGPLAKKAKIEGRTGNLLSASAAPVAASVAAGGGTAAAGGGASDPAVHGVHGAEAGGGAGGGRGTMAIGDEHLEVQVGTECPRRAKATGTALTHRAGCDHCKTRDFAHTVHSLGLHQMVGCGMDGNEECCVAIALSGGGPYTDKDDGNDIIYTGAGGYGKGRKPRKGDRMIENHELAGANLGLARMLAALPAAQRTSQLPQAREPPDHNDTWADGRPVRVVREVSYGRGCRYKYRYEGLYKVVVGTPPISYFSHSPLLMENCPTGACRRRVVVHRWCRCPTQSAAMAVACTSCSTA
jgi:hypothetical protein